MTNELLK